MKIMLATGGSGGHIFPALYVAAELKREGHIVYFAGSFGFLKERIEKAGYPCWVVPAQGARIENLKSALQSIFSMLKSTYCALKTLKANRPEAVAGFGGYGAFPVVMAAVILRIPVIIHEQNVIPGRANRLLAGLVNKIAVSFSQSLSCFPARKTVCCGCPCLLPQIVGDRPRLKRELGLREEPLMILVLGGSQGSRFINEAFTNSLELLRGVLDFQVFHICGQQDTAVLADIYQKAAVHCRVVSFWDDMSLVYQAADLAVSRAGAVTISELAAFGLPAVLIPYPYAGGHQQANAEILASAGTASILPQADLTGPALQSAILSLLARVPKRNEMTEKVFRPDAARLFAEEIIKL